MTAPERIPVVHVDRHEPRDCPSCRWDVPAGCRAPELQTMRPTERDQFWLRTGPCHLWEEF